MKQEVVGSQPEIWNGTWQEACGVAEEDTSGLSFIPPFPSSFLLVCSPSLPLSLSHWLRSGDDGWGLGPAASQTSAPSIYPHICLEGAEEEGRVRAWGVSVSISQPSIFSWHTHTHTHIRKHVFTNVLAVWFCRRLLEAFSSIRHQSVARLFNIPPNNTLQLVPNLTSSLVQSVRPASSRRRELRRRTR